MLVWLSAAVAFSLAMIVFSTIVSALTEALHRFFHMREAGLQRMLEQLYQHHLAPALAAQLKPAAGAAAAVAAARNFSDDLTRNLAAEDWEGNWFSRTIGRWYSPRRIQSLSWLEFIRRIADTDVGKAIRARGEREAAHFADDLAIRFERFGVDATAYFQQRARAVSITLAFAVAFALNVDAIALFSSFLEDPALTESFIASADRIVAAYEQQQERTTKAQSPEAGSEETLDVEKSLEQLRARLDAPTLAGLPIGFAYFPFCRMPQTDASGSKEKLDALEWRCILAKRREADCLLYLSWFASVAFAGFLIGLGGPFWFDAYKKLAAIVGVAGALGRRGGASEPPAKPAATLNAPQPPPKLLQSPSEALASAAIGSTQRRARRVRARNGRPLGGAREQ